MLENIQKGISEPHLNLTLDAWFKSRAYSICIFLIINAKN